jgi:hypothetical protein
VISVEAVDELLAMDVLDVVLGGIPVMGMTVDDEDLFATFRAIHCVASR